MDKIVLIQLQQRCGLKITEELCFGQCNFLMLRLAACLSPSLEGAVAAGGPVSLRMRVWHLLERKSACSPESGSV